VNDHLRKLVTIVTEAAIEKLLVADLEKLGAHGYTITEARGKGSRGARSSAWDASSNIRVEIVCDEPTSRIIVQHLQEHYYANFAMILFTADVTVVRPAKF